MILQQFIFGNPEQLFDNKETALNWYRELTPNQKVELKDCSELIGGIPWEGLTQLHFSFGDKIALLYNKLKLEGFDV